MEDLIRGFKKTTLAVCLQNGGRWTRRRSRETIWETLTVTSAKMLEAWTRLVICRGRKVDRFERFLEVESTARVMKCRC